MSATKHTPGPRISVSRREHPEVRLDDFAVSAGDLCVAVVDTEGEARRIAEALTIYRNHDAWHGLRAEMTEALDEALRWADESTADPCPVCGVSPGKCECWIGQARAAIAKAEGQS